jgi:membrane protease YdiL (CAAX protease family)
VGVALPLEALTFVWLRVNIFGSPYYPTVFYGTWHAFADYGSTMVLLYLATRLLRIDGWTFPAWFSKPYWLPVGLVVGTGIPTIALGLALQSGVRPIPGSPTLIISTLDLTVRGVIVGLAEEVISRGLVLSILRRALGIHGSVWIGAVLFGLSHLPHQDMVQVGSNIIFGATASYMFILTRSLWLSTGFHIGHDVVTYLKRVWGVRYGPYDWVGVFLMLACFAFVLSLVQFRCAQARAHRRGV